MTTGVAVIVKAPVPGAVKTRLCPPLSPAQACELAAAMLADVLVTVHAVGVPAWCVHAGPVEPVRAVVGGDVPVLAQRGDGLGERLAACQLDLFATGLRRLVLLAGDAPTVDPALLRAALDAADAADVVLGPARDGGYTVLVSRRPTPELFEGVAMGTAHVLEQTLQRARRAGLRAAVLEPRHDLDTIEDLRQAWVGGELAPARQTTAVLKRLLARPVR